MPTGSPPAGRGTKTARSDRPGCGRPPWPQRGALALGALPTRFDTPLDLALLTAWFAALILLMATDLDQHLLPDVITLPLIPVSLVALVAGWNPLLAGKDLGVASGIAAGVVVPAFLAVPAGSSGAGSAWAT